MKVLILAAAGLMATAVAAQTPDSAASKAPAQAGADDPNEVICRSQDVPGSRRRQRVCQTRAQWAAQRSEYRDNNEERDTQRSQQQTYSPY
jgi:hypothetical protein